MVYWIRVPRGRSEGIEVGVGRDCPGAGMRILAPGCSGQVPAGKLLIAMIVTTSVLNLDARSQHVSPDFISYSKGPEGVVVAVGSGVSVGSGVLLGVGLGTVADAVGVFVEVGVLVANNEGAFGPANHVIRIMIPDTTNTTAKPPIRKGSILCRLLKLSITD